MIGPSESTEVERVGGRLDGRRGELETSVCRATSGRLRVRTLGGQRHSTLGKPPRAGREHDRVPEGEMEWEEVTPGLPRENVIANQDVTHSVWSPLFFLETLREIR